MTTQADKIRAMADRGLTRAEISRLLGVPYGSVQSALRAKSNKIGRPASPADCPLCGASPSHQRKRLQTS